MRNFLKFLLFKKNSIPTLVMHTLITVKYICTLAYPVLFTALTVIIKILNVNIYVEHISIDNIIAGQSGINDSPIIVA